MAWKRGVSNNQAGEIRRGQVREFRQPSSQAQGISATFKITTSASQQVSNYTSYARLGSANLPDIFRAHLSSRGFLYLHAHKHPQSVITAVLDPQVAEGCIQLCETHLVNSKVCSGERETFTIYESNVFAYDGREGAIGNTDTRFDRDSSILSHLNIEVRLRDETRAAADRVALDVNALHRAIAHALYNVIVTLDDVYLVWLDGIEVVLRVCALEPESVEESEFEIVDTYRGLVDDSTSIEVTCGASSTLMLSGEEAVSPSERAPPPSVVTVRTRDDEEFPVKRRLLRPCISLTSVVQAGRGVYKEEGAASCEVPVDACTFDRVLLYLEHEARGEPFKFDPLIASELLLAAKALGISGMQACCERVLGSFQDRVRKTPIRLAEVVARNNVGGEVDGKRTETLLLMSGMVLDVSRWLYEHPGGSSIIPTQGLNVDCTAFFEIYHASKQSFLYLKEFYIGELAEEDLSAVPMPSPEYDAKSSDAFREQLSRVTQWRIKPQLVNPGIHKSF